MANDTIEDGGKYYGRGFIQLTGKRNYIIYNAATLGKADIVNNPNAANDPQTAAEIAAAFIATSISTSSRTGEDSFEIALRRVGGTDEGKDLKRKYYDLLLNNYNDLVGA